MISNMVYGQNLKLAESDEDADSMCDTNQKSKKKKQPDGLELIYT